MVAVGGGSVMDTAKAVNTLIGSGEEDFQPLAEQAGLWEGAQSLPPHIAFPTTAGTGCEVTNAMVVLDTMPRQNFRLHIHIAIPILPCLILNSRLSSRRS